MSIIDAISESLEKTFKNNYNIILETFMQIEKNLYIGNYEDSITSAGRFAEAILKCLLEKLTKRNYPTTIRFKNALKEFETISKDKLRDWIRIPLIKALDFLYSLRNKKGAHLSGILYAERTDAIIALIVAKWIIISLLEAFNPNDFNQKTSFIFQFMTSSLPLPPIERINNKILVYPKVAAKEAILLIFLPIYPSAVERDVIFESLKRKGFKKSTIMKAITECKKNQWIIDIRKGSKIVYKLTTLGLIKLNRIVTKYACFLNTEF
ncbi:MAG: hypothetical protein DRN49_03165 [Thaumarchaeota archaeon]|nr:MAG: hypothetical protein DRN49_03165 [Nitrososphaerota archaeon]